MEDEEMSKNNSEIFNLESQKKAAEERLEAKLEQERQRLLNLPLETLVVMATQQREALNRSALAYQDLTNRSFQGYPRPGITAEEGTSHQSLIRIYLQEIKDESTIKVGMQTRLKLVEKRAKLESMKKRYSTQGDSNERSLEDNMNPKGPK